MAKSLILNRSELESRSPLDFPSDWPSVDLKSILPFYIEKLENNRNELDWQIWLIIDNKNKIIIGSAIFKKITDHQGVIELGYQISELFRNQGYCFEAVSALVDWVFLSEKVVKITAECVDTNEGSIRVLEKLGMCCVEKDPPFLKWELIRSGDSKKEPLP